MIKRQDIYFLLLLVGVFVLFPYSWYVIEDYQLKLVVNVYILSLLFVVALFWMTRKTELRS